MMHRRIKINLIFIVFVLGLIFLIENWCTKNPKLLNVNYKTINNNLKTEEDESNVLRPIPTNPNGWPKIENILKKTSSRIKYDLWNYNFTNSGVRKLEDLLIKFGGKPVRSVVISAWRSGSTFLGELLNAMPSNFYHYEPLLKYQIKQIRGPPDAGQATSFLKNMLRCNYSGIEDYFIYGKTHLNYLNQFKHNTRLWDYCKYEIELCLDASFTASYCSLFPFQSMKLVRFRLHLVDDILQDMELNVKVVLLVRDPRGVMQSRRYRHYCQPAPDCSKPELVCADMVSDYVAARNLMQKYPNRIMVLRFEDLALNLNKTTHQLLKFLRLGHTQPIDEFLHTHTNLKIGDKDSTFRVSRDVPFKWRNILDFEYVEEIQNSCKEAMELWGYQLARNASHMTSKGFYPLLPYKL